MYSRFKLARKYLNYYLSASNGKGHGVHSPFVFDFIKNVLTDKSEYPAYKEIEAVRKKLLHNKTFIQVEDFGAGSSVIKTNKRQISKIAATSVKPKKYAQLLYRLIKYYKPESCIELGTSLGITGAYLASATDKKLYTLEGSVAIAGIARETFDSLKLNNAELINGAFEATLPALLMKVKPVAFVFIDGNHRKLPTLHYFHELIRHSTPATILVFDDIHWSHEMEEAWMEIKEDPAVTLTIDLFFLGIVLLRKDFKVKQHFKIRF
ncbi:MAG: class I SAM-dependent methyltransferase [Ferruginibacter sp.]